MMLLFFGDVKSLELLLLNRNYLELAEAIAIIAKIYTTWIELAAFLKALHIFLMRL